jgi:hypothetical protein
MVHRDQKAIPGTREHKDPKEIQAILVQMGLSDHKDLQA